LAEPVEAIFQLCSADFWLAKQEKMSRLPAAGSVGWPQRQRPELDREGAAV
jgi:hypothetical protein